MPSRTAKKRTRVVSIAIIRYFIKAILVSGDEKFKVQKITIKYDLSKTGIGMCLKRTVKLCLTMSSILLSANSFGAGIKK